MFLLMNGFSISERTFDLTDHDLYVYMYISTIYAPVVPIFNFNISTKNMSDLKDSRVIGV